MENVYKIILFCSRGLNLLRKLSHTTYDADEHSLLKVYRALRRTKCNYGFSAYLSAKPTSSYALLDSIHHKVLRLALGAFPTTRRLVRTTSVDIHRQYSILKFYVYLFGSTRSAAFTNR